MKTTTTLAAGAVLLLCSTAVFADPIQISNDDGYARLARWEQHLDDRIADGVRENTLDPRRALQWQKSLDSIEAHAVQSHYTGNYGIDPGAFRRYAGQLRTLGNEMGDDWGGNVYGGQFYLDGAAPGYGPPPPNNGYGPPPPPPGGYNGYGPPPPPPPQATYYGPGYEESCHRGNAATGTIFGAIGGGLLGGALSHGNGGAVVGGVVLGGLLGNTIAGDIDCEDHRVAFETYGNGLNGDLGRDYHWQHGHSYGTFTATREFQDHGQTCREFRTVTYRGDQRSERTGVACRQDDRNWHFR